MRWAHRRWERTVEAFVDGQGARAGRALAREHLRGCPDCRDDVALLLAVRSSLVRAAPRLPQLSPTARIRLREFVSDGFG